MMCDNDNDAPRSWLLDSGNVTASGTGPEGRLSSIANCVYTASHQGGNEQARQMFRRALEIGQNRYVGAAVIGSMAGLVLLMLFLLVRGPRDTVVLEVQAIEDPSIIRVYIGGEVANPGLFSLPRGSRVFDGVNAAGGLLTSADASSLQLAASMQDADQVIVPSRPTPTTPAVAGGQAQVESTPAPTSSQPEVTVTVTHHNGQALININTASMFELEYLPEIGPVIAARIVEYRDLHGPFNDFTELANVSGISDRMVEVLRPLITIGS
jgi:competence protein ComEA